MSFFSPLDIFIPSSLKRLKKLSNRRNNTVLFHTLPEICLFHLEEISFFFCLFLFLVFFYFFPFIFFLFLCQIQLSVSFILVLYLFLLFSSSFSLFCLCFPGFWFHELILNFYFNFCSEERKLEMREEEDEKMKRLVSDLSETVGGEKKRIYFIVKKVCKLNEEQSHQM
jgi:hypothetical protein